MNGTQRILVSPRIQKVLLGLKQHQTTTKIKSVALAVIELHWSEGISQSVGQLVHWSVHWSVSLSATRKFYINNKRF